MQTHDGWLVIMSKPKAELDAKHQLGNQGFDVYLPMGPARARSQTPAQPVPLFPRYLFARLTAAAPSVMPIRSTRGVSQVVRFGTQMAWATDPLIQQIQEFEARLLAAGTPGRFKSGDRAEVLSGPFAGVTADVLKSDEARVVLLLTILGGQQPVSFNADILAPV
ncbi:transcription termination/antitermination NusG family protein [Litorivicinus lipolyticus]|uniref:transcription termination/antitermination NusG family protein n=1 Tax=Litorivicinus lipolyticus TaxID=418701 RepID=UPI003B5A0D15